jgi:hypothetical protein
MIHSVSVLLQKIGWFSYTGRPNEKDEIPWQNVLKSDGTLELCLGVCWTRTDDVRRTTGVLPKAEPAKIIDHRSWRHHFLESVKSKKSLSFCSSVCVCVSSFWTILLTMQAVLFTWQRCRLFLLEPLYHSSQSCVSVVFEREQIIGKNIMFTQWLDMRQKLGNASNIHTWVLISLFIYMRALLEREWGRRSSYIEDYLFLQNKSISTK